MGIVYQINFPDGRFYIGHTTAVLKSRLSGHVSAPSSQIMYEILSSGKYNTKKLNDITTVLYEDWDSSFHELCIIFENRNCPDLLNKIIRNKKPSYNLWFDESINKEISINKRGAYLKYREYLELSGMNKDQFMDKLLNLYLSHIDEYTHI